MRRNMMNTVNAFTEKEDNIPEAYDICVGEMKELLQMAVPEECRGSVPFDGVYNAITTAFKYGFVLGSRAQRNGAIKKRL